MGSIRFIQKDLDSHPEGREDSEFCCTSLDSVITVVKWRWGQQSPSVAMLASFKGQERFLLPSPSFSLKWQGSSQPSLAMTVSSEPSPQTFGWHSTSMCVLFVNSLKTKPLLSYIKAKKQWEWILAFWKCFFFLFGITPATRWNILIHLPNEKAEVEN